MEDFMNRYASGGFTLIEIMIVVVIVSILAMIAVPAYNDSVNKARRTDGQAALMDIMARQERYFTENSTYTTNLSDLNISSASSQEGYYTISLAACGSDIAICVIATATPGAAQADDGWMTLDSTGAKDSENGVW